MTRYRTEIIISLFLIVATFVTYSQVLNHGFINYDDPAYVTTNINVKSGLTVKSITWAFTTRYHRHWHPLTWLSHMADCWLFGLNPGRHHLTSLLIHIVNTLLLFLVLNRMTGSLLRSAFVAALFALHPLHVESVAWIADRKDLLSTFFSMLAIWAYARYADRPGFSRYLIVLLFFVFALMSKSMAVTLPLVLLLLDYWPLNRFQLDQSCEAGNSNAANIRKRALLLIVEKGTFPYICSI